MLGTFMPGDGEIERTALHEMYLKFCRDNQVNTKILNNAGFGKIVKVSVSPSRVYSLC